MAVVVFVLQQESGSEEDAQGEELERALREKALQSMKQRGRHPEPSDQMDDSSD